LLIVVADDLPSTALEALRAEGWTIDAKSGRSPEQLALDVASADALVVRSATKVTAEIIAAAPRLRAIARAGTGVDNVDVDAASARGIVVMNAPAANSISVAELAMAQILALARKLSAADASMKHGAWDKKSFLGEEIRGKVLGLAGLGRIGQEVARRAQAFEMTVIAHDPFLSAERAEALHVRLVSLDELCAESDYLSLHMPSTAKTRHIFDAPRFAACKKGLKLVNTARGDLVDEAALAAALQAGHLGGAAIDVFETEPTKDHTLQKLPMVVASPHIAASTREGQELVGVETATALRDFLKTGVIRNAVNYPSVPPDEHQRLQPFLRLAQRLGALAGQMEPGRVDGVSVRYYGELATEPHPLLLNAAIVGLAQAVSSDPVTAMNARATAAARGIQVVESQSSQVRNHRSVISLKVTTAHGDRWAEGTVADGEPRLVTLDGVPVEAPLAGTVLVMANHDQPGVIGEVGSILGRMGVNIANFALGRSTAGAVGVVNMDDPDNRVGDDVLAAIRGVRAVKQAWIVRLPA
jgi:D-3-phosphoglycerate dehydrogenase